MNLLEGKDLTGLIVESDGKDFIDLTGFRRYLSDLNPYPRISYDGLRHDKTCQVCSLEKML
ncbi:MAG: hypothetical protein QY306_00860 [Anaerolineales bacterium]|nr:MAG: hypothetical protein QY306_00860 [Anaerolineales bacterium]